MNDKENSPRPAPIGQGASWFKAYRSHDAIELWRANPNAFWLLYVVAWRAKYSSGFNAHGLTHGQCLLGDYNAIGLSKQSYRTAKAFLEKHGFATFKPTPKGTIATLISTSIFEVLPCEPNTQTNTQVTHCQHTANTQVTPNVDRIDRIDRIDDSAPPQAAASHPKVINSDHSKLIAEWCECYERQFCTAYKFQGGRDGKAVKELLMGGRTVQEVMGVATAAWAHADKFNCKNCVTLGFLASKWNEINAELARATNSPRNAIETEREWTL